MSEVFADTSYFLALLNPADQDHRRALELSTTASRRLLTTAAVVAELGNAMSRVQLRPLFVATYHELTTQQGATVLDLDEDLLQSSIEHFASRPDKTWSLTDCISFVVMEQRGLREALTADRHFQQAGFRALLLESP